ncbi:VPLPA-CTERM sorting domain-containing protein [Roseovarius sp. EL26]|uniref:VPLPA-CTERM sorting domain-containing protein n=1 Tax=Roseovarius sp. EL26 TaxID=2126672 RepID=UPI000EA03EE4|nr:VPLPA-CTERM sorting domain-containing protein [Roseovarius sp. EL26]
MKILQITTAIVLAASTAQAATIVESTDFAGQTLTGLLSPSASPFDISDVGAHSVQGSLMASCFLGDCGSSDVSDTFSVNLGTDREIVSMVLSISNAFSGFSSSGNGPDPVISNVNVTHPITAWTINSITGNGSLDLSNIFSDPYTTGVYSLGVGLNTDGLIAEFSADWKIDFVVADISTGISTVPLPASAGLLLAGLGGFGLIGRRKRPAV